MDVASLKRPTDWFSVFSARTLDDPTGQVQRRELIVPLDQYPYKIGLGPNPRRPDTRSQVSKAIRETLDDNGANFHLLNRGITIVAKSLEYDNKSSRARMQLHETAEEEVKYGILDGGNTDAQINLWREALDEEGAEAALSRRYVNVQILIPKDDFTPDIETVLNDIKEARNTSVQVKQKSLADARRQFELLKQALEGEPFYADIAWKEGDKGGIDALQVITLLMLVFPNFSNDAPDNEPNGAYGRKEKCLDAFLSYSEGAPELLSAYISILPNLLNLFDEIQYSFPSALGGKFGKISEVRIFDEAKYEKGSKKYRKTEPKTTFLQRAMKYEYPLGWIFPVFASFRHLLQPTSGSVRWKRDPKEFWCNYKEAICERYEPHLKKDGYEAKRIATNAIAYSSLGSALKDLYKDELLAEAGIES